MRYQFLTFLIHSFLPPRAAPWPARRRVSTRQASTLTSPLGLAQACTLVPSRTCTDRHTSATVVCIRAGGVRDPHADERYLNVYL